MNLINKEKANNMKIYEDGGVIIYGGRVEQEPRELENEEVMIAQNLQFLRDGEEIDIDGINFARKNDFLVVKDMKFITRTPHGDPFYIEQANFAGICCNCLHPLLDRYNGYIIFGEKKEHLEHLKNAKINNLCDFVRIIKRCKIICDSFSNYTYFDLFIDCIMQESTLETVVGPIIEVVNANDTDERMYYYQDGTVIAKIRNMSINLTERANVRCNDEKHFIDFAEESFRFCKQQKMSLKRYAKYGNKQKVEDIFIKILSKCLGIDANPDCISRMLNITSTSNLFLVHYDNKKTMLITRNSKKDKYFNIPVKLDEDFQTVEEFQQWAENYVKPYCKNQGTDYTGFIYEFEKYKNELLTIQLNEAQNDRQLDKLTGQVCNKSTGDVTMNGKPERISRSI